MTTTGVIRSGLSWIRRSKEHYGLSEGILSSRAGLRERTTPAKPDQSVTLPPALILGGDANALSVARDLARMGVTVYAVGEPGASVRHSRCCRWIDVPAGDSAEEAWARFLLGPESEHLRGAVVLGCSDAALQVLAHHREPLLQKFRLDDAHPPAQLAMLDKLATYEHASAAGVPTPRFWSVSSRDDVLAVRDELVFPLMVKPRLSHVFEAHFGRKHVVVSGFDELLAAYELARGAGVAVLLVEVIPGGDDQLASYFTYLDDQSRPLFHYAKRVIRRYPSGMGAGCYHVTDWIPELTEVSNRLFRQVGLRGLANIEFKRDPRDGIHKLIECNARFVASDRLAVAAGVHLARFVYGRLVGVAVPPPDRFRVGMRLWDPLRDFRAFLELRRQGRLTLVRWLASIARRQTLPYFAWSDPMPTVSRLLKPAIRRWRRLKGAVGRGEA